MTYPRCFLLLLLQPWVSHPTRQNPASFETRYLVPKDDAGELQVMDHMSLPMSPSSHSPVYFYEFHHPPDFFENIRTSSVKADHIDEVPFVFGTSFWHKKYEYSLNSMNRGGSLAESPRSDCLHCPDEKAGAQRGNTVSTVLEFKSWCGY